MSRIGKKPIPLPAKVQVDVQGESAGVKGPNGSFDERSILRSP